jgi:hypothetical protein
MGKISDNKKAISLLVSYVLLITIAMALSGMVYTWLRFYVGTEDVDTCPDGISLVVKNYECLQGSEGFINITLKNNGRFKVDGFVLKVSNRSDARVGSYRYFEEKITQLYYEGEEVSPGNETNKKYLFSDFEKGDVGTVTLIKVQPFVEEHGQRIFCETISSQDVEC